MLGLGTSLLLGGARGFSPIDLADIKIWVKPDGLLYNGSNLIHQWTDASGNGNHLLQATETNKPLRVAGLLAGHQGARFDGVDNKLKAVGFSWTQPETIYCIFNQVTWVNGDGIFDGNANSGGKIQQTDGSPKLQISAGVNLGTVNTFTIGNFKIATVIFNGVNSLFQEGNNTAITGDAGSNDMDGIVLGATGGETLFGNVEIMEFIGYSGMHTSDERTQIKDYFTSKYNF